jgi:hypothetical protein
MLRVMQQSFKKILVLAVTSVLYSTLLITNQATIQITMDTQIIRLNDIKGTV